MQNLEALTFDMIENIESAATRDTLLDILFDGLEQFGFESFLITGLPPKGSQFREHTILNGWPAEWYERYSERGYYSEDIVATRGRETVDAFRWTEAAQDAPKGSTSERIMNEARDLGLYDGVLVPIYGIDGAQYCVTMAGREFDSRQKSMGALQMMCMYAHHRAQAFDEARAEEARKMRRQIRLSVREQECLRWVAAGKTDWDIGAILNISAHTAEAHVRKAMRKLNAVNRTQAVVEAMRGRHIAL